MSIDRRTVMAAAGGLSLAAATAAAGTVRAAGAPASEGTWFGGPEGAAKMGLRWVFSARVFFAERVVIMTPAMAGYTPAAGGDVWGPRLQGRVLPHSGADYYRAGFDTHYFLEASDGALIYVHNRGTMRRFAAEPKPGEDPVPYAGSAPGGAGWTRFRATPTFDAPKGPHEWMNRTVFVANAQRQDNPDHTVFTYYEVL